MDTLLTTLTLIVGALGLFYAFLVSSFGGWKKRGIPEAKSYPGIGAFPSTITQKRHVVYDMDEIYRQFRDSNKFVGIYSGRVPQLFIIDPELVHNVYVNDFSSFHDNEFSGYVDEKSDLISANNPFFLKGELWKERRTEMVPGMTPNRIKSAYPVTLEVCSRLSNFIREQMKQSPKDGMETLELCLRYTTEVVSDCVLGIHVATISDKPSHFLEMIQNLFKSSVSLIVYEIVISLWPNLKKFFKVAFFNKKTTKYFFDLMDDAIELRRKQGNSSRVDFLNFLLQLQEKKKLPNEVMAANIMTFLTDGFITTAHTIGHVFLGLARNQEAQKKLREEILKHTNEEGIVSFEALSEMPYLNACFHEALRIFPPITANPKICTRPYEFVNTDGTSYKMGTNQSVLMSIYSLHHDERFYDDPEEFKPERFLPENGGVKKYRDEGKFLGFGDGPRTCMGMRFALTQGKAAIVELVRNFQLKVNPRTRSDNLLDPKEFVSRLDGGIWLNFDAIN